MSKFELVSRVESATAYMEESLQVLAFFGEKFDHDIYFCKANSMTMRPEEICMYCSGIRMVERELTRICQELCALTEQEIKKEQVKLCPD